ncbi:MAG: TolC family protein [Armatimonadota bacterium]|nr:TolC family protein [bacterium]MCS7310352.1 TolC family protein [Armatimonadota bacterium]MDW8105165.1 TolC family protein [Armatimonadota bacterium]MDW8290359.1 TolC family protein [Armatimonadota bacterium]
MKRAAPMLCWIALLVTGAATAQQQPSALTLQDSIRIALQNSRSLRTVLQDERRANARLREAKGAGLPQLDVSANYRRLDRVPKARFPSFDPITGTFSFNEIEIQPIDSGTATVSLSQVVDISGLVRTATDAASLFSRIAALDVQRTRNEVVLQVKQAFYDVLRAQELVRVAEEALKNAETRRRLAEAAVEAGVSPRLDVMRADAAVAAAQQAVITARNALQLAKAAFNNVLGRRVEEPVELLPPDENVPEEVDYNQYLQEALTRRPELIQASLGVSLAEKQVTAARRDVLPSLLIRGQWDFNLKTSTFQPRESSFTTIAALQFKIWDSGQTQGRIEQARADADKARIAVENVREGISLEVRNAYLSLLEAREKVAAAERGLQAATESLRVARVRYEAGVSTQLELSDAELAFTQAQQNLVNARYDLRVAWARLEKAMGRYAQSQ